MNLRMVKLLPSKATASDEARRTLLGMLSLGAIENVAGRQFHHPLLFPLEAWENPVIG
jgi:hypothetical protein